MPTNPEFFISIIFSIWLLILTFLFVKFYFYYTKLIRYGRRESVLELLEEIIRTEESNKKSLDQLRSSHDKLEKSTLSHIQKVGLVRFNPFKDTGGDQSFILALVDAQDTGVVISSLHTRTGTRWYAKGIVRGKGVEHELSKEEEKALAGAKFLSSNG